MSGIKMPFQIGWTVGLILNKDVMGCRAMVGRISFKDMHGLQITPVEWLTGMFTQMDEWYPWSAIVSATVQTDEHNPEPGYWSKWQERNLTEIGAREKHP
jgi:hypothetical protein